jgi:protocatechuate 3,4-dioxygenase beta subunit
VQDSRGKSLPDALVLAWPMGQRQGTVMEARSGTDGRFALAGLPRGAWTLLAEAPGFGTMQLDRVDVPARPLVLKLEGESRSLGGQVLAGGKEVVGAKVSIGGPSLRTPRSTTTDKRGTFLFHGIGQGKYTMRASHGKLASLPANQLIDDGTGWLPPYRLNLETGAFVSGRVVDDTGRPLAGAPVEVVAMPSDDLPESQSADADGRFTLGPLPSGRYQVMARAPDHVLVQSPEVRLRADVTPQIELRLARACRLTGRVVDERGQPLGGVPVTAVALTEGRPAGADELTVLAGALPLAAEAAGLPARAIMKQGNIRTASTDAQGRFVLDEMPPGRARLEVVHPELLPLRREPIVLAPGERKEVGELTIQAGAVLNGRVLDENGQPIEAARIEARPRGKGPPARVASDRDGRFAIRVAPGDYSLVAVASARAPQSVFALHAAPGGSEPPIELRLPRADGGIEGEVRDGAGKPVRGVNVVALTIPALVPAVNGGDGWRPRSSSELGMPSAGLVLASAYTDTLGRFKVRGLPRGLVVLEGRHPEWSPVAIVGQVNEHVQLHISRAGGLEGEIREKSTGAFIARYELEAIGPQGRRAERIEKQGAGFSIMNLHPGRWTLKVLSPGFAPAEHTVEVPPGEPGRTWKREPSITGVKVELTRVPDASR